MNLGARLNDPPRMTRTEPCSGPLGSCCSSSEYGLKDHAPHEDEPLEPNSPYAAAKAEATAHALERGAVVLRLYSAYGPWEEPSRFVPTLLAHALAGRLPPLVSPDVARDFVHVDDVCAAFVLGAGAPAGRVYNVGSGRQTTVAEVVELARRLLASKPLEPYYEREDFPGPDVQSEEGLLEAAKQRGTTTFHPSSTCRMGPASDSMAVVDDQLRVHGLEGLRIIDASIMPRMISANLNAATMMIAEKGADLILGRTPPEPVILPA